MKKLKLQKGNANKGNVLGKRASGISVLLEMQHKKLAI
jgi:hypothetical protein